MSTSKAPRKPRRKAGAEPQKTPIKVAATQRTEQPVELGGKLYLAYCPKRTKFMKVFKPENIALLMKLDDPDPDVAKRADAYVRWVTNLLFGPKEGQEVYERAISDDFDEELDVDVLGEVLMHLAVIWTPDLAQNAQAMKTRMEPLTEKMETMVSEMKDRYGAAGDD